MLYKGYTVKSKVVGCRLVGCRIHMYVHVYPDTRYEGYIEDLPISCNDMTSPFSKVHEHLSGIGSHR